MKKGWIKLHRSVLENPVIMKDADHLAIWIYLLAKATHQERDVLFGGERVTLKPGQYTTGRKAISRDLSIHESKVQRVLKAFKIEQQIEQRTDRQCRLITVLNWHEYQGGEQRNEQRVNNDRTTSEQRVNTKQECKNERMKECKNINKKKKQKKEVVLSSSMKSALFLSNGLLQRILFNNENFKHDEKTVERWAKEIELLIRIDKKDPEDIKKTIVFAQTDLFWQSNILSGKKLRKNFETLFMQSKTKNQKTARKIYSKHLPE